MMKTFEEIYLELQSEDNIKLNAVWNEAKKSSEKARKNAFIVCAIIDVVALILLWNSIVNNIIAYAFIGILANIIIYFVVSAMRTNWRKACRT